MGLLLDPPAVRFAADDGSLSIDVVELGLRLTIGGWDAGLPVRIFVEGEWEESDGDPQLPVFHGAQALPPGHPIRSFVDTLLPEARALLPLFHEHQITLLRLLRLGAPAVQLAASAPNLVWLMLPFIGRMKPQDVEALVQIRRVEILSFVLGKPATPEMVRLVLRYRPRARVQQERETLLRALGQPALVREFRRGADVTMARLRVATALSEWLRFPSVREIVVGGGHPLDAYDAPNMARDARRLARDLGIVDADAAIARARTMDDLRRLHDRWMHSFRAQGEAVTIAKLIEARGTEKFPPAPVPGTDEIVYIGTAGELLVEGKEMRHCVGSYVPDCLDGKAFIYKVLAPERATLEVRVRDGVVVAKQLKIACNGAPTAATVEAVRAWLHAEQHPGRAAR